MKIKFLISIISLIILTPIVFVGYKFVLKESFKSPILYCPPGFVALMNSGGEISCFPKSAPISNINECFEQKTQESTSDFQKTDYRTNDTSDHKVLHDPQKNAFGVNKSDDCVLSFVQDHKEIKEDSVCKKIADIGYMVKCLDVVASRKK